MNIMPYKARDGEPMSKLRKDGCQERYDGSIRAPDGTTVKGPNNKPMHNSYGTVRTTKP